MFKNITLNVPYDLPEEKWDKIQKVYESLYGWRGFIDGSPSWFGSDSDSQYIWASVEPSGLLLSGKIEDELWTSWLTVLCSKLSLTLSMEIHDAEM